MTINERIKMVRSAEKLTLVEFGAIIGLGKSAISKMEQPGATIIDQNIKLICSELNVNENWLRTGEGDMFNPPPTDDVLALMQDKMNLTSQEIEIVRVFLELSPEQRKQGIQFVKDFSAKLLTMKAMSIPSVLPDAPETKQETYSRPDGISDQEWLLLQEMRKEKGTSVASPSIDGENISS